MSPGSVIDGLMVLKNRERIFNTKNELAARADIDEAVVNDVAGRLWIIVLSEKQENLVISTDDRAVLMAHKIREGARR
jgi:hypothetical protein